MWWSTSRGRSCSVFAALTGSVKTVNMSGRALVEFDGYNNIGWFDIDPAF